MNTVTEKHINSSQTNPPHNKTLLVQLNPVQSKLPSFYCEYCNREKHINSSQTNPPHNKTLLVQLNPVQSKLRSFYCECCDRDRQVYFMYNTLHRKSWCIYYNLMKTINTSSGTYTAIFHSLSAYDAKSDRLWHIFCVSIPKKYTY